MFEAVFGAEMPLAMRFFIAFLVVLGLIGLTAWVVRRFGSDRLGAAARGRQPRLAVVDAASVDSRRKLVIIRRDNVEHLLMIGGPSDVVVETNIVRGVAAQREPGPTRAMASDTLPRAVPLADTAWPLQPQPEQAARTQRQDDWTPPEPVAVTRATPSPRSLETLSGLAAELTGRTPADNPSEAPRAPAVQPAASAVPKQSPSDQNLAEMAQRLEAALRRPKPNAEAASPSATVTPLAKPAAAPASDAGAQSPYANLEQEMASLLGRQKTSKS